MKRAKDLVNMHYNLTSNITDLLHPPMFNLQAKE